MVDTCGYTRYNECRLVSAIIRVAYISLGKSCTYFQGNCPGIFQSVIHNINLNLTFGIKTVHAVDHFTVKIQSYYLLFI